MKKAVKTGTRGILPAGQYWAQLYGFAFACGNIATGRVSEETAESFTCTNFVDSRLSDLVILVIFLPFFGSVFMI